MTIICVECQQLLNATSKWYPCNGASCSQVFCERHELVMPGLKDFFLCESCRQPPTASTDQSQKVRKRTRLSRLRQPMASSDEKAVKKGKRSVSADRLPIVMEVSDNSSTSVFTSTSSSDNVPLSGACSAPPLQNTSPTPATTTTEQHLINFNSESIVTTTAAGPVFSTGDYNSSSAKGCLDWGDSDYTGGHSSDSHSASQFSFNPFLYYQPTQTVAMFTGVSSPTATSTAAATSTTTTTAAVTSAPMAVTTSTAPATMASTITTAAGLFGSAPTASSQQRHPAVPNFFGFQPSSLGTSLNLTSAPNVGQQSVIPAAPALQSQSQVMVGGVLPSQQLFGAACAPPPVNLQGLAPSSSASGTRLGNLWGGVHLGQAPPQQQQLLPQLMTSAPAALPPAGAIPAARPPAVFTVMPPLPAASAVLPPTRVSTAFALPATTTTAASTSATTSAAANGQLQCAPALFDQYQNALDASRQALEDMQRVAQQQVNDLSSQVAQQADVIMQMQQRLAANVLRPATPVYVPPSVPMVQAPVQPAAQTLVHGMQGLGQLPTYSGQAFQQYRQQNQPQTLADGNGGRQQRRAAGGSDSGTASQNFYAGSATYPTQGAPAGRGGYGGGGGDGGPPGDGDGNGGGGGDPHRFNDSGGRPPRQPDNRGDGDFYYGHHSQQGSRRSERDEERAREDALREENRYSDRVMKAQGLSTLTKFKGESGEDNPRLLRLFLNNFEMLMASHRIRREDYGRVLIFHLEGTAEANAADDIDAHKAEDGNQPDYDRLKEGLHKWFAPRKSVIQYKALFHKAKWKFNGEKNDGHQREPFDQFVTRLQRMAADAFEGLTRGQIQREVRDKAIDCLPQDYRKRLVIESQTVEDVHALSEWVHLLMNEERGGENQDLIFPPEDDKQVSEEAEGEQSGESESSEKKEDDQGKKGGSNGGNGGRGNGRGNGKCGGRGGGSNGGGGPPQPRRCYNCDEPGHYARDCQKPRRSDTSQGGGFRDGGQGGQQSLGSGQANQVAANSSQQQRSANSDSPIYDSNTGSYNWGQQQLGWYGNDNVCRADVLRVSVPHSRQTLLGADLNTKGKECEQCDGKASLEHGRTNMVAHGIEPVPTAEISIDGSPPLSMLIDTGASPGIFIPTEQIVKETSENENALKENGKLQCISSENDYNTSLLSTSENGHLLRKEKENENGSENENVPEVGTFVSSSQVHTKTAQCRDVISSEDQSSHVDLSEGETKCAEEGSATETQAVHLAECESSDVRSEGTRTEMKRTQATSTRSSKRMRNLKSVRMACNITSNVTDCTTRTHLHLPSSTSIGSATEGDLATSIDPATDRHVCHTMRRDVKHVNGTCDIKRHLPEQSRDGHNTFVFGLLAEPADNVHGATGNAAAERMLAAADPEEKDESGAADLPMLGPGAAETLPDHHHLDNGRTDIHLNSSNSDYGNFDVKSKGKVETRLFYYGKGGSDGAKATRPSAAPSGGASQSTLTEVKVKTVKELRQSEFTSPERNGELKNSSAEVNCFLPALFTYQREEMLQINVKSSEQQQFPSIMRQANEFNSSLVHLLKKRRSCFVLK